MESIGAQVTASLPSKVRVHSVCGRAGGVRNYLALPKWALRISSPDDEHILVHGRLFIPLHGMSTQQYTPSPHILLGVLSRRLHDGDASAG